MGRRNSEVTSRGVTYNSSILSKYCQDDRRGRMVVTDCCVEDWFSHKMGLFYGYRSRTHRHIRDCDYLVQFKVDQLLGLEQ